MKGTVPIPQARADQTLDGAITRAEHRETTHHTTDAKEAPAMSTETRIETPEQFEQWASKVGYALVHPDGAVPALVWASEGSEWFGIRPVNEDDGPFADLPEGIRQTYAVPVDSIAPNDDEHFTPFTVLWSA